MIRPIFFATFFTVIAAAAFVLGNSTPAGEEKPGAITPDTALKQLTDGNRRFREMTATFPRQDEERRCATFSAGQHPVAAVLSCADSRVPVELVFDQGIGDLFVVRVAGNVAATDEIGTFEYGVEHLNIPLIVVLGHTKCGAVTAVLDGAEVHGNLAKLVEPIVPAVASAKVDFPKLEGRRLLPASIRANVLQAMTDLTLKSPVIAAAVKENKVKIVGGVYNLVSGEVEWLDADVSTLARKRPVEQEMLAAVDEHAAGSHAAPAAHAGAVEQHDAHAPAASKKTTRKPVAKSAHEQDEQAEDSATDESEEKQSKSHASGKSESKSALTVAKENWMALSALLLGSTAMSGGLIAFLGRGRKTGGSKEAKKDSH